MPPIWNLLLKLAQAEVSGTLARLPAPLRAQATTLPVCYEAHPNTQLLRDGVEPDTLGLFVGPDFAEAEPTGAPPPQIIFFLENIWDAVEGEEAAYREEVQTTFLHELGHFLGLDEIDLEDRGLD